MDKIIGYSTKTMFCFNCYAENEDKKCICEFQITGDGDYNEMKRLRKTLLNNGFHLLSCHTENFTVPIFDR